MSMLSVSHASVRLGDKDVLNTVSASFARGQVTCIVGPNGAGKSTLLTVLAGLRTADHGDVQLEGVNMDAVPPRLRAQRIGYLPQIPEVAWPVDVRTLVGLGRIPFTGARGLSAADGAIVDRTMQVAGISAMAARNVASLSGGERARVLIARALAGEPAWLLADEPLTGLDPGYQLEAATLFRSLARDNNCGVIVTLHDLHMALRMADRILVLAEGRILADDVPARALSPAILAQAYGVQTRFWDGQSGPMIEIIGGRG
jgi:iron complex transport system ATP-binding protein